MTNQTPEILGEKNPAHTFENFMKLIVDDRKVGEYRISRLDPETVGSDRFADDLPSIIYDELPGVIYTPPYPLELDETNAPDPLLFIGSDKKWLEFSAAFQAAGIQCERMHDPDGKFPADQPVVIVGNYSSKNNETTKQAIECLKASGLLDRNLNLVITFNKGETGFPSIEYLDEAHYGLPGGFRYPDTRFRDYLGDDILRDAYLGGDRFSDDRDLAFDPFLPSRHSQREYVIKMEAPAKRTAVIGRADLPSGKGFDYRRANQAPRSNRKRR